MGTEESTVKRMHVVCVLVVLAVFACGAVAQVPPRKPIKTPTIKLPATKLRPIALTQQFKNQLSQKNVAAAKINHAAQTFEKLPNDLQSLIVATLDEQQAERRMYMPRKALPQYLLPKQVMIRPEIFRIFRISNPWPEHGNSPGHWVWVRGFNINDDCQIMFDGAPQTTYYLDFNTEFFPNTLAFQIPGSASTAHDYSIMAHNTDTGADSNTLTYRVIAPRGYRGYNGWKFANFGDPQIPWACYRDFFGQSAVEYPNGAHRPSAQAWYDAEYKGVGNGGNCYGMSVSSIRSMRREVTTLHSGWFNSHPEDFTWLYPWNTQTKQTVQEDQGGQLSAEMAAKINYLWNHQDHREAWTEANTLTSNINEYAILGFWGNNWGHAVVCYDTEVAGDQRKLLMYDNNVPYQENETGGPDKSISRVNWGANTYTYPGTSAYKMVCFSYADALQGPSLPAAATGGAMGTVVATVNGGEVSQITDSDGHTFFNADGSINTDDATRIPNSMKYVPLTGTTPTNFPPTFIFSNITGKDLTFTVEGAGNKTLRMFQAGDVFEANFAGHGDIRCEKILSDERSLVLTNPEVLNPLFLLLIKVRPSERVYRMENLNWMGTEGIKLNPTSEKLNVLSAENLRFNMQFQTFAGNAVQTQSFRNVAIQANQLGEVSPTNWNNLPASQLNLKLLNPNTNQQIRNINIRPIQ